MRKPWQRELKANERVLWSGRPGIGAPLTKDHWWSIGLGLLFLAFGLPAFFGLMGGDPVFGVISATIGLLFMTVGPLNKLIAVMPAAYALTDRRAIIATYFIDRPVTSISLNIWTHTLPEKGERGSIEIGPQPKRVVDSFDSPPFMVNDFIGFYKIKNPQKVHKLIERIKRGAT